MGVLSRLTMDMNVDLEVSEFGTSSEEKKLKIE